MMPCRSVKRISDFASAIAQPAKASMKAMKEIGSIGVSVQPIFCGARISI